MRGVDKLDYKYTYEEYLELEERLKEASECYYNTTAIMTDEEYDRLSNQIKYILKYHPEWKTNSSIVDTIGAANNNNKIKHDSKMYSIQDAFNQDDLNKWLDNFDDDELFYIEPKYDGCSLNITFENGTIVNAATRGDGNQGESVLDNLPYFKYMPLSIRDTNRIEVRGEVIISKEDFKDIIKTDPALTNARNTASGSVRLLDPEIVKNRHLCFIPYGLGYKSLERFKTHEEAMKHIYNIGYKNYFNTEYAILPKNKIWGYYEHYIKIRDTLEYEIDGLVIRLNDLSKCNEFTYKYPKFILALKFPHVEKETRLIGISNQVGRTGVITPVGIVEPIDINGVTVENVTLNNYFDIKEKDIMLNDYIAIIRSGDVIPKITSVFKHKRTSDAKPIIQPEYCECGNKLKNTGRLLVCDNLDCKERVIYNILNYLEAIEAKGIGYSILELLYNSNLVKSIEDLYKLTKEDLVKINIGDKTSDNVLHAINNTKAITLDQHIKSLGIDTIGSAKATILSKLGVNWYTSTVEDYIGLLGPVSGSKVYSYVTENIKTIEYLKNTLSINANATGKLNNLKYVLTGDTRTGRKQLEKLIKSNGGTILNSPTVDSILIANEPSNSSKYRKATELNIKIITEDELLKEIT